MTISNEQCESSIGEATKLEQIIAITSKAFLQIEFKINFHSPLKLSFVCFEVSVSVFRCHSSVSVLLRKKEKKKKEKKGFTKEGKKRENFLHVLLASCNLLNYSACLTSQLRRRNRRILFLVLLLRNDIWIREWIDAAATIVFLRRENIVARRTTNPVRFIRVKPISFVKPTKEKDKENSSAGNGIACVWVCPRKCLPRFSSAFSPFLSTKSPRFFLFLSVTLNRISVLFTD